MKKTYLKLFGPLACFTRPEMKVERVSYQVPTPSAVRGILEAILYKPGFRWQIHRIAVKKPINFITLRRNEVKSRIPTNKIASWKKGETVNPIIAEDDRTQRNTLALRDVEYIIEASIKLKDSKETPDNNYQKYYSMFERRAEKGQCFYQPCFGCREFPAHFELAQASDMQVTPDPNPNTQNLGLILYDVFDLNRSYPKGKIEKVEPQTTFFSARLDQGIVTIPSWEDVSQLGTPSLGSASSETR